METNNTEGAIEFCKDLKEVEFKYGGKIYDMDKNINDVIELLQRGEKYKQMWKKCKKDIARASVENWKVSAERFLSEMEKSEQKYFSK